MFKSYFVCMLAQFHTRLLPKTHVEKFENSNNNKNCNNSNVEMADSDRLYVTRGEKGIDRVLVEDVVRGGNTVCWNT